MADTENAENGEAGKPDDAERPETAEEAGASVVLSEIGGFLKYVGRRFGEDRCLRMAAGLSYTSLLAIVPLTAIAFSMLAAFPVFSGVRESLQEIMFANLLPSSAEASREYFDQFVKNTTSLSAVGIVALAATAVLLLGTIEADLNAIFRVARPRALLPRLLVFWALLTLGPLLLGASFSLSTYFFAATQWLGIDTAKGPLGFAALLAPTLMIVVLLTLFYMVIPNRPVGFVAALVGGVSAGLAFTALRKIFGWYVVTFPTYQNIYGALSVVPIFLVWMYLSWLVVLVGAVLTASMSEWQSAGGKPLSSSLASSMRLVVAMQVLAALYRASRDGVSATRTGILRTTGGGGEAVDAILEQLHDARFVERTASGRWVLARSPETTTLYDVYRALGLGFGETVPIDENDAWSRKLSTRIGDIRRFNRDALSATLAEILADDVAETPTRLEVRA